MQDTLILHHFAGSPFAEKVRLMLGFKRLPWASVMVPLMMPKPDVVALTGGYRKTPFMQVGGDVYCDTALIARLLEAWQPAPTLFPTSAPLAPMLAQWADRVLFAAAIPYALQGAGAAHVLAGMSPEMLQALQADRAAFAGNVKRLSAADATQVVSSALVALDAQLADGRNWLFGSAASIADFSVAHCLWYVRRGGPLAQIITPHQHVSAWLDRVLGIEHGQPQMIDATTAIGVAAVARSYAPTAVMPGQGFDVGDEVSVAATDYGVDPVLGRLIGLAADEVVITRDDARAGTVHVHFPRQGFQIRKMQQGARA